MPKHLLRADNGRLYRCPETGHLFMSSLSVRPSTLQVTTTGYLRAGDNYLSAGTYTLSHIDDWYWEWNDGTSGDWERLISLEWLGSIGHWGAFLSVVEGDPVTSFVNRGWYRLPPVSGAYFYERAKFLQCNESGDWEDALTAVSAAIP